MEHREIKIEILNRHETYSIRFSTVDDILNHLRQRRLRLIHVRSSEIDSYILTIARPPRREDINKLRG